MAEYVALWLRSDKNMDALYLAGAFGGPLFRPVALGGWAFVKRHLEVIIAGNALETFAGEIHDLLGRRAMRTWRTIHVDACETHSAEVSAYQAAVSKLIETSGNLPTLAPCETSRKEVGATFLAGPGLQPSVLQQLDTWMRDLHGIDGSRQINLYGTLAIATRDATSAPWSEAYRLIGEPRPAPFLELALRDRASSGTEIRVTCRSNAWIDGSHALGGQVGAEEARANLAGLGWLVDRLDQGVGGHLDREMHLEGAGYFRERENLATALLHKVDSSN
jgi:hypothetical protein